MRTDAYKSGRVRICQEGETRAAFLSEMLSSCRYSSMSDMSSVGRVADIVVVRRKGGRNGRFKFTRKDATVGYSDCNTTSMMCE